MGDAPRCIHQSNVRCSVERPQLVRRRCAAAGADGGSRGGDDGPDLALRCWHQHRAVRVQRRVHGASHEQLVVGVAAVPRPHRWPRVYRTQRDSGDPRGRACATVDDVGRRPDAERAAHASAHIGAAGGRRSATSGGRQQCELRRSGGCGCRSHTVHTAAPAAVPAIATPILCARRIHARVPAGPGPSARVCILARRHSAAGFSSGDGE